MRAAARVASRDGPGGAAVVDLTLRRIERALRRRARYRYVSPRVVRDADGFRIESPCCSRNVDPAGGVIDIARLAPGAAGIWRLYARDHDARRWSWWQESADLDALLDTLCVDAERVFWP
ncbi:conserved protein of unknown function [Burkholderia multivorans]